MANSYFRFKQFTIEQNCTAMKVGTDGVLLGSWANVNSANRILDVGAGTGLIAIMAAQRNQTAMINAVEIDEQAYLQANENIKNCPWTDRIKIYHQSFQQFANECLTTYDAIISNPPYFNNSLQSNIEERNKARHSEYLPHDELVLGVKKLLADDGLFSIILPSTLEHDFSAIANKAGLFCSKKLWVKANEAKQDNVRVMLEFGLNVNSKCYEDSICIETDQRNFYTNKYKELTKNFYLKF